MNLHNTSTLFVKYGVTVDLAPYEPREGVSEWHAVLRVVDPNIEGAECNDPFEVQMRRLYAFEDDFPAMLGPNVRYVMKRYFVSDSANQCPLMRGEEGIAISTIQQPLMDGSKIAVWVYLVSDMDVSETDGTIVARHNGYEHLWRMGMYHTNGNSYTQTEAVLIDYENDLARHACTLADNCVRTWFFVRDVDTQYAGMVKARWANFVGQGLTPKTHYIASTGIGALPTHPQAIVQFGAYALRGLEAGQQRYLYAPTHLNPTYEYGVTFERGVALDFGDRRHVYISGTASINNRGEVMYPGDIRRQTQRMWENVETLLAEADTTFDEVRQIVVYLRDVADYNVVRRMFRHRFGEIPTIIALAPVCRPAWLIEMECIAIKEIRREEYRPL